MARKEKKEKSGLLSTAGILFEIWKCIVDAVLSIGGNDEDLRRILTEDGLAQKISELIMSGKQNVRKTYKVAWDYSKTLSEMIKAGNYGWFNDDITETHFPLQGASQHEVELELVHLNRNATTKEVLEHLNSLGLEPAKIEHLLAFGATYPEIQKEFPVVALGSVWIDGSGSRYYPYLNSYDSKRKLSLSWYDVVFHWIGSCRFLSVRK